MIIYTHYSFYKFIKILTQKDENKTVITLHVVHVFIFALNMPKDGKIKRI